MAEFFYASAGVWARIVDPEANPDDPPNPPADGLVYVSDKAFEAAGADMKNPAGRLFAVKSDLAAVYAAASGGGR